MVLNMLMEKFIHAYYFLIEKEVTTGGKSSGTAL